MKHILIKIIFILSGIVIFGCGPRVKPWSSYGGVVIDDATGKPMADVAVFARYYQYEMGIARRFLTFTETKTDTEGKFMVPSRISLEFGTYLDFYESHPEVAFYKSGYSSYVSHSEYDHEEEELRPGGGNVIHLYPVFTDKERLDALDFDVKEYSELTEFTKKKIADEEKYLYGKHEVNYTIPCDVPGKDRPAIAHISDSQAENIVNKIIGKQQFEEPIAGIEFIYIKGGNVNFVTEYYDRNKSKYLKKEIQDVDVKDFYIGKYEITREQWEKFMAGGYASGSRANRLYEQKMPVVLITWECAIELARRLSAATGLTFRLPTEQEWEYVFSTGKEPARWSQQNTYRILPVDAVYRDAYGVYGINVNVSEYCLSYLEPQRGDVVLGEFGNTLERVDINHTRRQLGFYGRDEYVGFRLVLEIPDALQTGKQN